MALEALHDLRTRIGDAILHAIGIHMAGRFGLHAFEIALPMFEVELIVKLADGGDGLHACPEIPYA